MISNTTNPNLPVQQGAVPSETQDHFDIVAGVKLIWDAIFQYKWIMIISVMISLVMAGVYIKVWPPVYKAEALVVIERDEDISRDTFYVNWNVFRKEHARTEVELAISGPILSEVIDVEELTYDDVYHPFTSQLKYFWETSWPGRKYQALKDNLFGKKEDVSGVSEADKEKGKTLKDLQSAITFMPIGESNAGRLSVKGPSPRVADIANTLLRIYSQRRIEKQYNEAKKAFEALDSEVKKSQNVLDKHAARRLAYLEENQLQFDFQKETLQVEQLAQMELEVSQVRQTLAQLLAKKQATEKQIKDIEKSRKVSSITELNRIRENAKLRRMELILNLQQAQEHYVADSPEVRKLEKNLATVEGILKAEPDTVESSVTFGLNERRDGLLANLDLMEAEVAAVQAGLKVAEEAVEKMRKRLSAVPKMQKELLEIDRDYSVAYEKTNVLMASRSQAEVALATLDSTMPSFRVAGEARRPGSKSWPTLKIVLPLALIIGTMMGATMSIFLRLINGTVSQQSLDGQVYDLLTVARVNRPLQIVKK